MWWLSKSSSDLGGGCVRDVKALPTAALTLQCRWALTAPCPRAACRDAVFSPGCSLLRVGLFFANPCALDTAQVSFARRGLGQSPCSLRKALGVMSKSWKKENKGGKKRKFALLWLRSTALGLPQPSSTAWAIPGGVSGNILNKLASQAHVIFGNKLFGKLGAWTAPGW